MRCSFIKADGCQCEIQAITRKEYCYFHLSPEEKFKVRNRPMTAGERAIILSREIRKAAKWIKDPKERARLVKGLMELLQQVDPATLKKEEVAETLESRVDAWKRDKGQTS